MHFMVMNGTAWQLSDYYFHLLSCIINLRPITHFFSCIPHIARTKKGKKPCKEPASPEEWANSDGNDGAGVQD